MGPHRSPLPALVLVLCCALLLPAAAGAAGSHHSGQKTDSHQRRHRADRAPAGRIDPGRAVTPRAKKARAGRPSAGAAPRSAAPAPPTIPVATPAPVPAPAPPSTSAPAGTVTFKGLFDGSFSGWYVQSLSNRATINGAHPDQGSAAGRFEVQQGDVEPDTGSQRSEVTGPTFREGEDVYIRDNIRVPVGYSFQGNWQLIDQLHEKPWSGSPGIATFLDPNRMISFGAGDGSPMYWRGPQLEGERWYDLVYRVNLERNSNEGFVELWLDGIQQTLLNGQTRMYGETIQTAETYLKAGIYRSASSTGVSVVEHDNIVVGTSLAAVMAN